MIVSVTIVSVTIASLKCAKDKTWPCEFLCMRLSCQLLSLLTSSQGRKRYGFAAVVLKISNLLVLVRYMFFAHRIPLHDPPRYAMSLIVCRL